MKPPVTAWAVCWQLGTKIAFLRDMVCVWCLFAPPCSLQGLTVPRLQLVRQAGSRCLSSHRRACSCPQMGSFEVWREEWCCIAYCSSTASQPVPAPLLFSKTSVADQKNHLWRHVYSFPCQHRDFYLTGKTKVTLKKTRDKRRKGLLAQSKFHGLYQISWWQNK